MTEKRFAIIDGIKKGTHSGIWDNQKQNNQRIGDELWLGEVVAMLNEGVMIAKENEHLKSELVESKKAHSNCDKLWWKLHDEKEQLEKENITIKNTIHNMMESERTHIGYNVLKQAYEAIK